MSSLWVKSFQQDGGIKDIKAHQKNDRELWFIDNIADFSRRRQCNKRWLDSGCLNYFLRNRQCHRKLPPQCCTSTTFLFITSTHSLFGENLEKGDEMLTLGWSPHQQDQQVGSSQRINSWTAVAVIPALLANHWYQCQGYIIISLNYVIDIQWYPVRGAYCDPNRWR